jgi:hypothetical protein
VAWALPSTQRPDSDFNSSPLPSTFKTFLSVAAWSEVWPYSYVSCRTCATPTPTPPYSHQLPSFSHLRTPFPFQSCTSLDVLGIRSATLLLLRTRTKYPLPRARASHSDCCCFKHVIYPYAKPLTSLLGHYPVHTRPCCPPTLHFLQPYDWCLMKASEGGRGRRVVLMYGGGDSTFKFNQE